MSNEGSFVELPTFMHLKEEDMLLIAQLSKRWQWSCTCILLFILWYLFLTITTIILTVMVRGLNWN